MKKILAKPISHSASKRDYMAVKYIVIHNTGNSNDTAVNNGKYFANGNTRAAGAHFFIDQSGDIVKSVNLNRAAWAVGGIKYSDCNKTGGGKYYGVVNNANSVSIELCDIVNKDPSDDMVKAIKKTIKYIRKHCPNAIYICRHFDVNGKQCPMRFTSDRKWNALAKKIGEPTL